ncbi:MAG TPA: radical SAM protein [Methylomusa anaerophila]|uniref:Cyclic pyranopterin monophosphate synthase n=1 Tax=Methylomusa anaerophila TaxID=1930071 RepID=A0A348AH65_9FIRM|nr:radical SAM protein [Methylomusa anaerophila]BBB90413.1 cyclic pyranopterin monophosphate synthase [Methylomusa anaerophila]HML90372.1 radical SAM protein [Methylomusa anaerophila]
MTSDKVVSSVTPGGRRTILGEALPLATPFLIQIFPVYGCNFRCGYCLHALPREQHGYISEETFMDIHLYKKCINDLAGFKNKLKMLRFAGIGEPLLHKNIAAMVSYAKSKGIAESIDIVTNGVLLNEELSLALINAGLDKLRISIQGVSEAGYKKLANVNMNFANFINNLHFFYKQKRNTKVYIKIIDCALTNEMERERFFDIFGEVSDTIAIEHLTPTVQGIDYTTLAGANPLNITQNGSYMLETSICPQPFYMIQINPDGAIVPCCSMAYPGVFGNASEQSIPNIWHGEKLSRFRRLMLAGVENAGRCCNCSLYKYGVFPEDILDPYVQRLKSLY